MYLKSITGKILYEGCFASIKQGLEMAVEDKVDLTGIDLRHANLANAALDKAYMPKSCLWGASLTNANMTGCDVRNSDFRCAQIRQTCMAEGGLQGCDFNGSYFSNTILRNADLSSVVFSCPSLFTLNLEEIKSLQGAIYNHHGETKCAVSEIPLVIKGMPKPLIFMDDTVLVGPDLRKITLRDNVLKSLNGQIPDEIMLCA